MKSAAVIFLICNLILISCGSAAVEPGNEKPLAGWCEIYARTFALGVMNELGPSYRLDTHWGNLARFSVKEPIGALYLDVRDQKQEAIRFQCIFVPWGDFSFELSPEASEYLDVVAVTPQVIVFLPVLTGKSDVTISGDTRKFREVLSTVAQTKTFREVLRDFPAVPIPAGLELLSMKEYPCSVEMTVNLAKSRVPSDQVLLSLVPGKLLILSLLPDTKAIRVRVISPQERVMDYKGNDEQVRRVFSGALGEAQALYSSEREMNNLFIRTLDTLKSVLNGQRALYEQARKTLASWLGIPEWVMREEETRKVFPDYSPKLSQDTLLDYRGSLGSLVLSLPEAKLENLKALLGLLAEYSGKAIANPGRFEQGKVFLGGDPQEYVPSDDELIAGELGERVELVVKAAPPAELKAYLARNNITLKRFEYVRISFRHVDVMGSGRFFYASPPVQTTVILP